MARGAFLLAASVLLLMGRGDVLAQTREEVLSNLFEGDSSRTQQIAKVRVCNRSMDDLELAVSHKEDPNNSVVVVVGWLPISASRCLDLTVPHGEFYYYAVAQSNAWETRGYGKKLCIAPGNFNRVYSPSFTCPKRFVKAFVSQYVASDVEIRIGG